MKNTYSEQWAPFESIALGTIFSVGAVVIVVVPFLVPRSLLSSWDSLPKIYDSLAAIFPYLGRSLPLSKDPDFYIISKVILFCVGTACVVICSLVPLSRNVVVRNHSVVDKARNSIWWFWLFFALTGYGIFFETYKLDHSLSFPSKTAVEFPLGITVGNLVQFGVFVLAASYMILVKHYFRIRNIWKSQHVDTN